MVIPCPCKGQKCVCNVEGAGGLTFSGNGKPRQPYRAEWQMWALEAEDNDQAEVTIVGDGSLADPWTITVDTLGGSMVQTVYENDGTWRKPSAGTVAQVVVIGGGGGGGASANPEADAGGSGGAGGAMSVAWFPFDDLPDEVDIEVGQGGRGGRPISGEAAAGDGGKSFFGPYLYAGGGRGGTSQANAAQTQHTTVGGTPPSGGPGGAGAVRDGSSIVEAPDHTTYFSPTGGGMGEGNVVFFGSNGGDLDAGESWGGEGGAGAQNVASPGDHEGVDGGLYGGGGGGGRAWDLSPNMNTKGGDGAPGVVVVTVW